MFLVHHCAVFVACILYILVVTVLLVVVNDECQHSSTSHAIIAVHWPCTCAPTGGAAMQPRSNVCFNIDLCFGDAAVAFYV